MAPETRLAQRPKQITQRLETEKVEAFVGNLKSSLLRLPGLSTHARLPRRVMRLVDRDVILLLHALDELLDQIVQLAIRHHLFDLLAQVLVEQLTIQQRLFRSEERRV